MEELKMMFVDIDGDYLEDGKAYCYLKCKRCNRKVFIKLDNDMTYDYPKGWARYYGPEIEGNLCIYCEEELHDRKNRLYIDFMKGL